MKLLVLDYQLEYINPTRQLVQVLFQSLGETCFFGPGFTSEKILEEGLDAFIQKHGPFDMLAASEHVLFAEQLAQRGRVQEAYQKIYSYDFSDSCLQFGPSILKAFQARNEKKLVVLLESDFYNFRPQQISLIEELNGFILSFGAEFFKRMSDLPFLAKEKFGQNAHDGWLQFLETCPEKVISFPHFVGEHEFVWGSGGGKSLHWVIPGAKYWARKYVRNLLRRNGISYAGPRLNVLLFILEQFGFTGSRKRYLNRLFQYLFTREISQAAHCFTCGSGLGMPIRKFFEIPALGSLLVGLPCNGFRALGFRDGVNALSCPHPRDIINIHHELNAHPERVSALAAKGQNLVWKKHSLHARVSLLKTVFEGIHHDTFFGSHWQNGEFVLKAEPAGSGRRS
jgi:hypothetical protein